VANPPDPASVAYPDGAIGNAIAECSSGDKCAWLTLPDGDEVAVYSQGGERCKPYTLSVVRSHNGQVVTSAQELCEETGQLKSTKSGRARVIPLGVKAKAALKAQRALQIGNDFVFVDEVGRPIPPGVATKTIAAYCKTAGIVGASLHSLRHSAATAMISRGADVRSVATALGHSSPVVTMTVYSHAVDAAVRAALELLDDEKAIG
jgi:integrase